MKPTKTILLLFLISVVTFSCSSDSNTDVNEYVDLEAASFEDVAYGDHESQVYDIFLPAHRDEDTKTLILIHGGGWTSGDKKDMNGFVELIKNDLPNTAIVNMNYRLANEAAEAFPMQINDVSGVVNHVKSKLNDYQISDDFGLIGTSAGAHLAMLWCYAFDNDRDAKMVCSIVGPTNFTDPAYLESEEFENLLLLQELYGIDLSLEFLKTLSPYHQVTADAPPTILFYGGQDPLVPVSQGSMLQSKLQELGVMHEYTLYPDAGHGWAGLELLDTWSKLKSFITAHLED
ncbi:alpha/beta hydrolase fold domain-containing protein [Formosa sp. S-31]|uniref:alpha/beta hydrolase fold domain-containing protein n=1 Tax=Formosa sp. S-31 TaxID=2790949 RepID=UPI003EC1284A